MTNSTNDQWDGNRDENNLAAFRRLFSQARDQGVDDSASAKLEQLLLENPALRREYVELVLTESQLEDLHSRPLLDQLDDSGADRVVRSDSRYSDPSHRPTPSATSSKAQTRGDVKLAGLPPTPQHWSASLLTKGASWWAFTSAAMLLVAAVIGFTLLSVDAPATIVAVDLGGKEECDFEVGDRVDSHWMQVDACVLHLSFSSSAMVAIHGPAEFRANGPKEIELRAGAISVHVPEAAKGFRALAERIEIEDLGTGFSMDVSPNDEVLVHVTEGKVNVRDTQSGTSVQAEAGQFVNADFERVNADSLRLVDGSATSPTVLGQFAFSEEHVTSLGHGAFAHDRQAYIFLESKQRRLPYDLPFNLLDPGRYTSFSGTAGILPAGTVVDCYLVHCAPKSNVHEATGTVTFPGEIVGVICDHDRLNATNELLGATWTLRCHYIHRGLETIPFDSADVLTISNDRRSISATLRNKAIDQFRVLVRAN